MSYILVTGGAGYIGSHICQKLADTGHTPLVLDNFSNGHKDAVSSFSVIEGDLLDKKLLRKCFQEYEIDAVIHTAGLIEAGASMHDPAPFYENNTIGSINLLEAMRGVNIKKIVFSSTAALYGNCKSELLNESFPVAPINPYGKSKAIVEDILLDYASIYQFKVVALRFFNAAGADPEIRLGERHNPESHLIPLALQTASGSRSAMKIYGTDYDTHDGTCIRDFVHVDDLATAHVRALHWLSNRPTATFEAINIGTGYGNSVKEILSHAIDITGIKFTVTEEKRRSGDPDRLVADVQKANVILNWEAQYTDPRDIIRHAWAFEKKING